MIHPIIFSIPNEKICKSDNVKIKILSNLIPGNPSTYIFNSETEYYDEYKKSYFAITTKKSGWDCMRHYEIMANGCLPYFIDIENCPINTMELCPKDLFLKSNALYKKFSNKKINEIKHDEMNEYNELRNQLLEYIKTHLTTNKIAKYILQKTNFENVKKILYLSGNIYPDYLRCLVLHGFKELIGENCHDYPKVPHIYKTNDIDYNKLYGKGMSYSNLLDPMLHNDNLDYSINNDIKNKHYDIIIYGSYHRGMPFYNLICEIYKPNEIILLCGEDIHCCSYDYFFKKGHNVFIREL